LKVNQMTTEDRIIDRIRSCVASGTINLGTPKMAVHPLIKNLFTEFVDIDPNHVAFQDRLKKELTREKISTLSLEKEVIQWVDSLYGKCGYDGQVTSGGTESNITALWLGREKLLKESGSLPVVIGTELTHYTIDKSCRLLGMQYHKLPVDEHFGMNLRELDNKLSTLNKMNSRAAIIVLTIGHTMTGSHDDFRSLRDVLDLHDDIKTYVHIDAAIGGLVYPFLVDEPVNLEVFAIDSLSLDFHKTGFVPYGAGVILVKPGLYELIGTTVPYVSHLKDKALLASRPGLSAIFCWAVTMAVDKGQWQRIMLECRDLRDVMIQGLLKIDGLKVIWRDPASLGACVSLEKLQTSPLYSVLIKKYQLYGTYRLKLPGEKKLVKGHKMYINNDITPDVIHKFLSDVEECAYSAYL